MEFLGGGYGLPGRRLWTSWEEVMDFLPGDYGISFLFKTLLLMGFEPQFGKALNLKSSALTGRPQGQIYVKHVRTLYCLVSHM